MHTAAANSTVNATAEYMVSLIITQYRAQNAQNAEHKAQHWRFLHLLMQCNTHLPVAN
jgi:hypothetical protein